MPLITITCNYSSIFFATEPNITYQSKYFDRYYKKYNVFKRNWLMLEPIKNSGNYIAKFNFEGINRNSLKIEVNKQL